MLLEITQFASVEKQDDLMLMLLQDLGLDSLDHVEVIMAIEDEFGFEVSRYLNFKDSTRIKYLRRFRTSTQRNW